MTKTKATTFFESKLLEFIAEEDPLLSMLQWMTQKLVEVKVAHKIGAEKGKHETNRVTYRSGIRVRRFDTRLGTLYLVIPKLRKGGYIPFLVTRETERAGAGRGHPGGLAQRGLDAKDRPCGEEPGYRAHQRLAGERDQQGARRDGRGVPQPTPRYGIPRSLGGRPVREDPRRPACTEHAGHGRKRGEHAGDAPDPGRGADGERIGGNLPGAVRPVTGAGPQEGLAGGFRRERRTAGSDPQGFHRGVLAALQGAFMRNILAHVS